MPAHPAPMLPRLRQVVLAAWELEEIAGRLRAGLDLGEPFSDPGVGHFGLRNAVFALGDTFLEVVSPVRPETAAGRLLERRGGDCGYMVMFQVPDLAAARDRTRAAGVREVFEVALDDMAEVHLHPADMRGAIVSMSSPRPPDSWRWGGPDWYSRAAPLQIVGTTIGLVDPEPVAERWAIVLGEVGGLAFTAEDSDRGVVQVALRGASRDAITVGGVRFVFNSSEEER